MLYVQNKITYAERFLIVLALKPGFGWGCVSPVLTSYTDQSNNAYHIGSVDSQNNNDSLDTEL